MTVSRSLSHARHCLMLSQRDVASHLGVTESYVSYVESGKKPPPRSPMLVRWARFLRLDPAVVVHESGRPLEVAGSVEMLRQVMEIAHGA